MGEIISSKIFGNHIICKILLANDEALALKNAFLNVNLFSADLCNHKSRIFERGRNGVSKFFEIPFNLRFRKKKDHKNIFYQKLELPSKVFYLYVINKDKFNF
jgi:hypothetical protein